MAHKAFCCLCSSQRKWFTASLDRPRSPINYTAQVACLKKQAAWKTNGGYRFQALEIILTFSDPPKFTTKACFAVRGQLWADSEPFFSFYQLCLIQPRGMGSQHEFKPFAMWRHPIGNRYLKDTDSELGWCSQQWLHFAHILPRSMVSTLYK